MLPFNIGCGSCANCERRLSGFCLTCADPSVMPGMAGAAYGFKMVTEQCNLEAYNRRLRYLTHHAKVNLGVIVSPEKAPNAHKHFDDRDNGWTKVILHPNTACSRSAAAGQLERTPAFNN